jgi:nucleolar protein 4
MHKHSDALRFLRWANNNPEVAVLCSGQWWKEELESLLKAEKAKDETSRDEMRMKRLREEIERVGGDDDGSKKKSKGTLIVEFSIENAQVVQRRNVKQKDSKAGVCVSHVFMVRPSNLKR